MSARSNLRAASEAALSLPVEVDRPALAAAMIQFGRASALMDPWRLRLWDAEGLTVTQLRLLSWVAEEEGLSNADLADRLYVTRPSVSALLDRLERGGFIRREISPNDRRGISIWLEARGRNAVRAMRQEGYAYTAGIMEALTDEELCTLADSLAKMVAAGEARRYQDLETEPSAPAS
jgi:MarR family transcriptional regulator, organic hydroperoxide resistance regulator